MRRIALMASLIAAGTVLGPSLAVADGGTQMCLIGTVPMSVPAWLFEATQDPHAQLAPARPLANEEDLMWCASADDPRCSPLRTDGETLISALAHGLLAPVLTDRASVPRPPVARLSTFVELGGPRDGTHSSIDRPPRG
jgi:hypothetical protein